MSSGRFSISDKFEVVLCTCFPFSSNVWEKSKILFNVLPEKQLFFLIICNTSNISNMSVSLYGHNDFVMFA